MGYPQLTRRTAFAARLEATPGSADLPTMADHAIRLMEAPTFEEGYLAENMTDEIITGKLGVLMLAAPGARFMRVRARIPLVNTGAAPTADALPECDPILVAAGMTRVLDEELGTVTYEPNDDPSTGAHSTLSIILQMDGKEYKFTYGVVEELTIENEAASFPTASIAMVGIAAAPTEKPMPDMPAYNNNMFPIWKGANSLVLTNDADAAIPNLFPRKFTFNAGIQANPRINANATDGHSGYRVTGRVPQLDMRLESQALTDWNPRDYWNKRKRFQADILVGALQPQYSKIGFKFGDLRVINANTEDDNAMRYTDLQARVTMPLDETPEYQIVFK